MTRDKACLGNTLGQHLQFCIDAHRGEHKHLRPLRVQDLQHITQIPPRGREGCTMCRENKSTQVSRPRSSPPRFPSRVWEVHSFPFCTAIGGSHLVLDQRLCLFDTRVSYPCFVAASLRCTRLGWVGCTRSHSLRH